MVKIYLGAFITPRTSYIQNSGEQQEWGGRDPSLLPNELAVVTYHLGPWDEDGQNHPFVGRSAERLTKTNGITSLLLKKTNIKPTTMGDIQELYSENC
jgi:uracil-DNA glycosylase